MVSPATHSFGTCPLLLIHKVTPSVISHVDYCISFLKWPRVSLLPRDHPYCPHNLSILFLLKRSKTPQCPPRSSPNSFVQRPRLRQIWLLRSSQPRLPPSCSVTPPADQPRHCSSLHVFCTLTSNLHISAFAFPWPEMPSRPQRASQITSHPLRTG